MTVKQYTPNLQDDSDANYNDNAGRRIKLERGCDKVTDRQSLSELQSQTINCNSMKFNHEPSSSRVEV